MSGETRWGGQLAAGRKQNELERGRRGAGVKRRDGAMGLGCRGDGTLDIGVWISNVELCISHVERRTLNCEL